MNFNQMVMNSLKRMEEEGTVEKIVDEHVQDTVQSVVKDLFGSYSGFGRELKDHVKEALQINFRNLDLASYNHLILKSVQDTLDDILVTEGVAQIKEKLETLLANPKREYKLSELVKELQEEVEGLEDLGYEEYHEMSLHVDGSYGSWWIGLDARHDIDKYDCKYRILVGSDNNLAIVKINDREFGNRNVNDFDVKAVLSGLRGLEETLFKIYASGAKIIVDEDSCDMEVSNPEYQ